MKLLSLNCNKCGAPLDVPGKVRYLTCQYCSAKLSVQRSNGAAYTEVLEDIDERTEKIADDVETIKLQNRLERLDREWNGWRVGYMIRGKDGEYSIPTMAGSMVGGLFVAAFGVVWIIFAFSMGAPVFFPLFGVIFIAFALFGTITVSRKARAYKDHQRRYESERRDAIRELDERQR